MSGERLRLVPPAAISLTMNPLRFRIKITALLIFLSPVLTFADADDNASVDSGGGSFGLLDIRSKYYQDVFPEPFRVEDTAIDNEVRFDWEHDQGKGAQSSIVTAEVQKSVGILTFELQVPYVTNRGAVRGEDDGIGSDSSEGLGNIELGTRFPVYQYISKSGIIDNSVGFNFDAGAQANSRLSKNTEISPGIFDDLAIGERFSVQTLFSFSSLLGPATAARESFEYGLAFGYAVEDEEFKLPHIERLIPLFELVGETALDGRNGGHNALTGTLGVRAEFKPIGKLQPQFGVGYIFPIDKGGRDEVRWGITTSVTFEF